MDFQESSVSRTKREIGERKPRGKKFSLSDKKNVLVSLCMYSLTHVNIKGIDCFDVL